MDMAYEVCALSPYVTKLPLTIVFMLAATCYQGADGEGHLLQGPARVGR
jgi:hypothetical protein